LTKEEIERMIKDAEEFAEEDKIAKEKIDSKNQLDNYLFSMKNTIEDPEKLANKLTDEEKSTIKSALEETENWLKSNGDASKEEFDE
jgi:heat shock protein 5